MLYNTIVTILRQLRKLAGIILPLFSLLSIIVLLYDIGFQHSREAKAFINQFYHNFVFIAFVLLIMRIDFIGLFKRRVKYSRIEWLLFLLFTLLWVIQYILAPGQWHGTQIISSVNIRTVDLIMIMVLFVVELSIGSLSIARVSKNPAIVFLFSFLLLIVVGTLLLLLPNSTTESISVVDALFTSTSAVCVTGLIVVDTATAFTHMGQTILLILIQTGGIGILTFTSFFGVYLRTSSSFQNQVMIGDMLNESKLGDILKFTTRVVIFTLVVELLFAGVIFFMLPQAMFNSTADMIRFSVFHSISAFCNAGFSTMSEGLYTDHLRFNYPFLLVISFLVVVGGLGFTIIFNFFRYLKYLTKRLFTKVLLRKTIPFRPRIIQVHSRIVVWTTLGLLVFGFLLFFLLESGNVLSEHGFGGKIVTAIFASVTPRTAGFNTVNMELLMPATIILYFLLMLIGGSPGSTAGGIKTTTFAVTVMNVISLAKGKNRVEVFNRELSIGSLRRAYAVISLSMLIIGLSVFLIHVFQPELDSTGIIFECISAFSTVGLTLGTTAQLGTASKLVIVMTMFLGRIGTLTIIVALFRKVATLSYRYPKESIQIS